MSKTWPVYNIYELRRIHKNENGIDSISSFGMLVKAQSKIEARLVAHESEGTDESVWMSDYTSRCTLVGHVIVGDQPHVIGWRQGEPLEENNQ